MAACPAWNPDDPTAAARHKGGRSSMSAPRSHRQAEKSTSTSTEFQLMINAASLQAAINITINIEQLCGIRGPVCAQDA